MSQDAEKLRQGDNSGGSGVEAEEDRGGVKSFQGSSVEPVDVTINNVSVRFRPAQRSPFRRAKTAPASKLVLDAVSATAKAGTLTALIGASGSGKTVGSMATSARLHS